MIKLLALLTLGSANLINCYTKYHSQWVRPSPIHYPLHHASFFGLDTVIRILVINPECNVNARDFLNRTPLHCAAARGNNGAIAILLAHGANIDSRELNYLLPEDLARINGHTLSRNFLTSFRDLE